MGSGGWLQNRTNGLLQDPFCGLIVSGFWTMSNRGLWVRSGIAGMLGVACYVLAITLPWPETQFGRSGALVVASAWPILSIVYSYGLCSFIAVEAESTANRLAFVLAVAAFTTVLAMIVVQLAVSAGIGQITTGLDDQTARALRRGLRLIDLGLDVAWDILIGTALVCSGVAMRRRAGLGLGWAVLSAAVGIVLIGLNAVTFPWPPGDRGLFDIGPVVGLFVFALAARLAQLGTRLQPDLTASAAAGAAEQRAAPDRRVR